MLILIYIIDYFEGTQLHFVDFLFKHRKMYIYIYEWKDPSLKSSGLLENFGKKQNGKNEHVKTSIREGILCIETNYSDLTKSLCYCYITIVVTSQIHSTKW